MVNKPIVSIIMATYNRAHFIMETLYSIQNQTFNDWECLIIDDEGTDATEQVIQPLLNKDERFKFLKRPITYQKGLPGCRNYGLDIAQGTYVIFFDDDDIVHPQNLEICVEEISKENLDFCRYIRKVFIDEFRYNFDLKKDYSKFYIDKIDIDKIVTHELPFNSCAVLWDRNSFLNDRFNEKLMYAEEWELYTRVISKGLKGVSINKCLFYGRKHLKSNTGEYYENNFIRRQSKSDAIELVVNNLKSQNLISNKLLKYFILFSFRFKEFKLFNKILASMDLSYLKRFKWIVFYKFLPIRLFIYKKIIRKYK